MPASTVGAATNATVMDDVEAGHELFLEDANVSTRLFAALSAADGK
ncbi:MAG TPA: hypothetical protein VFK47_01760 [Ktedonobacteraceae bacterium]|nr:hypothetical protein [Ktedonobacteraceae bacterium]